ncbi:MAG: HAMP domain-containing sensor histidine kinase [Bacillota bacterium]|nr:HAMP domain-containing sensor histidine kinase [Bacillota bacterium]
MEQGMYQEIENKRNHRIRLLRKLILGALLFLLGWSVIIGMEYRSYREKLALAAQMTKEETDSQTPFAILKGASFDIDVKEFQKQYGYDRLSSNIYGREYQQKRIFTGILVVVLYLVYAGAILHEYKCAKKEMRERQWKIAEAVEDIDKGNGLLNLETDNPAYEALERLDSHTRNVLQKAQDEKEKTKEMVTDISHQLKTPIAALKSCFEVLENATLTDEERREFEKRMEKQLQNLEQLSAVLVNISRMEAGLIDISLKNGKIFETILAAVNGIWEKADAKAIEIEMDICEEMENLEIMHDSKWLKEAILNILENAVKYSEPNTNIVITVKKWVNFLRIEIADEGVGIPKKEYHKIFQRFYRGENEYVQKEEGSGIGLYLTRKIVDAHKGMVFVERKEKKQRGSVFVIQLPYESLTKM